MSPTVADTLQERFFAQQPCGRSPSPSPSPNPILALTTLQERLFLFNSKYDTWQLDNVLQTGGRDRGVGLWMQGAPKDASMTSAASAFSQDFMAKLPALASSEKNGGFITSCLCHDCPWRDLRVGAESALEHYVAWAEGRAERGLLIDSRGPNGDGELEGLRGEGTKMCSPW